MLRSDLCDYSNAYVVGKGRISVTGTNDLNKRNKKLKFKNNALFRSCKSKINNALIDNTEDLDIVMPIYDNSNNNRINNNKTTTSKSFEYKTKVIGSMPNNSNNILDTVAFVPLKYLSNFWRSLDLPLINCELELDLKWIKIA